MLSSCVNPSLIVNPKFDRFVSSNCDIYVRNHRVLTFSYLHPVYSYQFSPRKFKIRNDEIDTCYVVNVASGETIPLYMEVPCGRCALCRKRKADEYCLRASAESNRFDSVPLFITFTYSDVNLPPNGLEKRDCQLFYKRLRSMLDYYGVEHNLRYIMVGEYGSKTHRPHYHAILWNFPKHEMFPNITSVIHFIERAWSRFYYAPNPGTGKLSRVALRDKKTGRVLRYPSGAIRYKTVPIGWVKVLPVTRGCTGYVTKYMRKPCNVPPGMNPTFMLSSRRGGGIGSSWLVSMSDFYRENFTMESISVLDEKQGVTVHSAITPYIKSKLFPSCSQLDRKYYDIVRKFYFDLSFFKGLCSRIRDKDMLNLDRYDYANEIMRHYYEPFESLIKRKTWLAAVKQTKWFNTSCTPVEINYYTVNKPDSVWQMLSLLIDNLNNYSLQILRNSKINSYFASREIINSLRCGHFMDKYKDTPITKESLARKVESLNRKLISSLHRETF